MDFVLEWLKKFLCVCHNYIRWMFLSSLPNNLIFQNNSKSGTKLQTKSMITNVRGWWFSIPILPHSQFALYWGFEAQNYVSVKVEFVIAWPDKLYVGYHELRWMFVRLWRSISILSQNNKPLMLHFKSMITNVSGWWFSHIHTPA